LHSKNQTIAVIVVLKNPLSSYVAMG